MSACANAPSEHGQEIPFMPNYFGAGRSVSIQLLDTLPIPPSLESVLMHAETAAYVNFLAGFFLEEPNPERIRRALRDLSVLLPILLTAGDPDALAAFEREIGIEEHRSAKAN